MVALFGILQRMEDVDEIDSVRGEVFLVVAWYVDLRAILRPEVQHHHGLTARTKEFVCSKKFPGDYRVVKR